GVTHVQDSRDLLHEGRSESPFFDGPARHASWWPSDLGAPDSAGMQNDTRYAWFSKPRRLAIERDGKVTVYDTGEYRIAGFSQQQGGRGTMGFTSQHGSVDVDGLPVVGSTGL